MLRVIEPATELPVSLERIKEDLGIVDEQNDTRLTQLIWRAVDLCEQWTGRSWCVQQFELVLPAFTTVIELPRPPLDTVDQVNYCNADNEQVTLDAANYYVVKGDSHSFIQFINKPDTYQRPDCVQIQFTTDALYPYLFHAAVSLIVGHLNENREGQDFPDGINRVLGLLRDGQYK